MPILNFLTDKIYKLLSFDISHAFPAIIVHMRSYEFALGGTLEARGAEIRGQRPRAGENFGRTKSPEMRLVAANALSILDSWGHRPQCPLATPT